MKLCTLLPHLTFLLLPVLESRVTYNRERTEKMYRSGALYIAKLVVDLPFEFLWPIIYGSITYFLVGLHPGVGHFVIFLVIVIAFTLVAASMFFAIATVSPNLGVAMALGPLLLVLFILGSGFWVLRSDIPGAWVWVYYISYYRYAFQALLINEFEGLTFVCDQAVCPYATGSFPHTHTLSLGY